jgi:hypothetical protein
MRDPTHQEMFDFLAKTCAGSEDIRFDIEEAIYWFACHYHSGQWSNLYAALCQSEFKPGMNTNGPYETFCYDCLVDEYAGGGS